MKRKFRVGGRVSPVANQALGVSTSLEKNCRVKDRIGVIRVINDLTFGVQFRRPFDGGNHLGGILTTPTGYWFWASELRLLPRR